MANGSIREWDDVSIYERFARFTRSGTGAVVNDPAIARLLDDARSRAWAIYQRFGTEAGGVRNVSGTHLTKRQSKAYRGPSAEVVGRRAAAARNHLAPAFSA
ncbi:MAG TPA: hypothetical protein VHR55_05155 [Candidatus Limnocylindria bacterium]|nr:hypothetical protein [Candidatus Limnocylindria bacterium]